MVMKGHFLLFYIRYFDLLKLNRIFITYYEKKESNFYFGLVFHCHENVRIDHIVCVDFF